MLAHLWNGMPAPREFVEYKLCDRFKCLPSQLRNERYEDVMNLLTCMSSEKLVEKKREELRTRRGR